MLPHKGEWAQASWGERAPPILIRKFTGIRVRLKFKLTPTSSQLWECGQLTEPVGNVSEPLFPLL